VNVLTGGSLRWKSAVNATTLRQSFFEPMTRNTGKNIWTGGFANRVAYKEFSAGIDMLYRFGKGVILLPGSENGILTRLGANSFSLQNVYVGYNLKFNENKLALFANARNLYQNERSTITDNRMYYGLGFKLEL
jgi:hypothetical protein